MQKFIIVLLFAFVFTSAQGQKVCHFSTRKSHQSIHVLPKLNLQIPKMTYEDRVAILSPPNGYLVYQTDSISCAYYYRRDKWIQIQVWYRDADGDGLGNPNRYVLALSQPKNYVLNYYDVNDSDASNYMSNSALRYKNQIRKDSIIKLQN